MPAKRWFTLFAGLAAVGLFTFGMIQLLAARFEGGDAYPSYSSLLAGPRGTRLLYDSLTSLPQVTVSRHRTPLRKLRPGPSLIVIAGITYYDLRHLDPQDVRDIEALLRQGCRVLLTFQSIQVDRSAKLDETRDKFSSEKEREERRKRREKEDRELARWEVQPFVVPLPEPPKKQHLEEDDGEYDNSDYEEATALTTQMRFRIQSNAWKVLQTTNGDPTIIERPLEGGTLVLVANGVMLTNRALLDNPQTVLISRLIGNQRNIVFDESHLGLVETASTMGLARKYGLTVPIIMMIGLFALFIWRNSQSLVPPPPPDAADPVIQGRDAASGFVNLLKLAIPAAGLIQMCYQQWQRSAAGRLPMNEARATRLRSVLANSLPKSPHPLQDYRSISAILTEKKIS